RPGDPAPPPAQDGPRVRRQVPGTAARDAGARLGRLLSAEARVSTLPADFSDLEPFAAWAIPTERARYAKRLSSTMDELQAFYDAALARMDAAAAYLERLDINALPDDGKRLLWLYCSLLTVSFQVELCRQSKVRETGSPT